MKNIITKQDAKELLNMLNAVQIRGDFAERIVELKRKMLLIIEGAEENDLNTKNTKQRR